MFIGILASSGISGGGAWSPKDLSGILTYYRSWEGVNMGTGDNVASLEDLISGDVGARAVGGPTLLPQLDGIDKIGGVNAIRIDANTHLETDTGAMTYPDSSEGGYFVVFEKTVSTGGGSSVGSIVSQNLTSVNVLGSDYLWGYNFHGTNNFKSANTNTDYNHETTLTTEFDPALMIVRQRTGEQDMYLNGTESTETSVGTDPVFNGATKQCFMGASVNNRYQIGKVCEFGYFGDMTDAEVLLMATYVNDTYGI